MIKWTLLEFFSRSGHIWRVRGLLFFFLFLFFLFFSFLDYYFFLQQIFHAKFNIVNLNNADVPYQDFQTTILNLYYRHMRPTFRFAVLSHRRHTKRNKKRFGGHYTAACNSVSYSILGTVSHVFYRSIERFHSRDQRPYCFTKTKDNFCIKIELNSRRNGCVYQYGCRFFVVEQQHGCRDVI